MYAKILNRDTVIFPINKASLALLIKIGGKILYIQNFLISSNKLQPVYKQICREERFIHGLLLLSSK